MREGRERMGRNRVAVGDVLQTTTQGSPESSGQPWALGRSPVGAEPNLICALAREAEAAGWQFSATGSGPAHGQIHCQRSGTAFALRFRRSQSIISSNQDMLIFKLKRRQLWLKWLWKCGPEPGSE